MRGALAPRPLRPGPRPRASPALALLLASVALAGCAQVEDPTAPSVAGAPVAREGFFTAAMGVADAPEDGAGAVRAGSFFQAWAEGADYPTWTAEPMAADVAVSNLSAKLFLRGTGPVVESVRFPDVMIYAGAGGAFMGFASAKFSSLLLPGEVHEIDLALAVPEGGLVVPEGEALAFKVVPVMHQNDAADIEILVGGDAASRANWTATTLALAPVDLTKGEDAGEAVGSAYAGEAAPPTVSHQTVVPTETAPRAFLVWMNTTAHQGIPDIDLALVAPDGTQVAFSGTPTPREFLRLSEPNLRQAGDYVIVVTSYGSARATFSVEWLVG